VTVLSRIAHLAFHAPREIPLLRTSPGSARQSADFTGTAPDAAQALAFSAEVVEQLDGDGFVLDGERVARWLRAASSRHRL
jgi:hypothetical protein